MDKSLEQQITDILRNAAPAEPAEGWEGRVMEALADVHAQRGRPKVTGRARAGWRRWLVAAGALVALLVGVALWLFPGRRGDVALAAVARAMANVTSAHFVGWEFDRRTGQRRSVEGWIKGPKFRMVTEGQEDIVDDGKRLVTLNIGNDLTTATIDPPGTYGALGEDMTYLDLFRGGRAFLEQGMEVASWDAVVLPDGRQARKGVLVSPGSPGLAKVVLIVDADTDLLLSLEEYDGTGRLVDGLERVEYDVEIPDSVFQINIPENALVFDKTAPPSQASAENWKRVQAEVKRLRAKGAVVFWRTPPGAQAAGGTSGGGMFHPGLLLHPLDNNGTIMLYTPWNTYVVFGKVLIEDGKGRLPRRVVENEEFAAPGPPVQTIEERKAQEARDRAERARHMPTPEMRAKWDAKAKELVAVGAKHLCQCYPWCCPVGNIKGGCTFESANEREFRIWYSPDRGEYYIMGKVRIHNDRGFDQTVEDGWIKVPGPPPKLDR